MDLRARLRTGKQRIELFCLLILVSVVFDNGVRVGWVMRMSVEVAVDELRMVSVRGLSYMEMLGRQQSQAQNTQHWQAGEDATRGATFFCHKGIHYRGRSRSSQISGREAICVFTREMCVVGDVIDWRGLFPVTLASKQLECSHALPDNTVREEPNRLPRAAQCGPIQRNHPPQTITVAHSASDTTPLSLASMGPCTPGPSGLTRRNIVR
jgi:hypothetical protein